MGCGKSKAKSQDPKPEASRRRSSSRHQSRSRNDQQQSAAAQSVPTGGTYKHEMNPPKTHPKREQSEARGAPSDGVDWEGLYAKLPIERTEEEKARRYALFDQMETSGNGYMTLNEADRGCREVLGLHQHGLDTQPVVRRAFAAASKCNNAVNDAQGDDLGKLTIERCEFRMFMVYLRRYFELQAAFERMDTSGNRKIGIEEFKAALPQISQWGITVDNPEHTFRVVDRDHSGQLDFDEFADWAIREHLKTEHSD